MQTGFQSSFIPKDPVVTQEIFKKKKAGPLGVLVVSLFVSSIIISISFFAYKNLLKNDIEGLKMELAEAGRNIDRKTINDLSKFSKKLKDVKSIVSKHQIVSSFMHSLASSTVSSVFFNELSYSSLSTDGLTVIMKGKAGGYGVIALQEDVFVKNKYWKSVSFSNLSLTDGGSVNFDVTVLVDPMIALYNVANVQTLKEEDDLESGLDQISQELEDLNKIESDLNNL